MIGTGPVVICPTCDRDITDPDLVTAIRLDESAIWDTFYYKQEGYETSFFGLPGPVILVVKSVNFSESQGEDDRESFFIVEYQGKFYRKKGTVDSYGETDWSGTCKPVQAKMKTVRIFE